MKKIFIAFVAAAGILCSCSEQNTDVTTDEIKLSAEMIPAGPDGVSSKITVTSPGDWRLAGECDWVHPSAVVGKSGQEVTFTVDPNTTGTSLEATFKFFTGSLVKALKVTCDPNYTLTAVSETTIALGKESNVVSVKLKTNITDLTQTFSNKGAEWILFEQKVEAFGWTMLSFKVAENKTYGPRTSVITIAGMDKKCDIAVTQAQTDTIACEKSLYSTGLAAATVTIKLKSNFDYTVEIPSKYTWIHRTTPAASSSVAGLVDHTETFTVDEAMGLRVGKITFKDKTGSISQTVTIQQVGDVHVYASIPDVNFRKWLADNDYIVALDGAKCELTSIGQNLTAMDIPNKKIQSLEGITAFTKLTSLKCNTSNSLATIPLGDLAITSFDFSYSYSDATVIVVSSSKLTSLKWYYGQYAESIDVSACPALNTLDIRACKMLKTLVMKTGQTIAKIQDGQAGIWNGTEEGTYQKVYK